jgi:hypothetical protein
MRYTILIYENEQDFASRTNEKAPEYWAGYTAYSKLLTESGVMVGGAGLQGPDMGTSVQLREGKRLVHDGPFADTKEQLGGYFVIEVPDLDTALKYAAECPAVKTATVEVRPHLPMPAAQQQGA